MSVQTITSPSSTSNDNNNSQVPTFKITLSSSASTAQQKLDSLLQQESEFNNDLLFSDTTKSSTTTTTTAATTTTITPPPAYPSGEYGNTIPKHPPQAHLNQSDLPTYDHATIDMPPSYASHNNKDDTSYDNFFSANDQPWPITKKLYVIGFVFWPLWFVGMGFSIFGKKNDTRKWGRRCAWNSLIILIIFGYLVVAYIRTGGKLIV